MHNSQFIGDKLLQNLENEVSEHYRRTCSLVKVTQTVEIYIQPLVDRVVRHVKGISAQCKSKAYQVEILAIQTVARLVLLNIINRRGEGMLDLPAVYELMASVYDWEAFAKRGPNPQFPGQLKAAVNWLVDAGDVPTNDYVLTDISIGMQMVTVSFMLIRDGGDYPFDDDDPYR